MRRPLLISLAFLAACGGRSPADPDSSGLAVEGAATADSQDPVVLRFRLRDTDGLPIAGAAVKWDATGARNVLTPASAATDAQGEAVAYLRSQVAEVKVVHVEGGSLDYSTNVRILAGDIGSASTVSADPPVAFATGTNAIRVDVHIRDRYGNAVPFAPISIALSGADLRAVAALPRAVDEVGAASFDLVARVAGDKEVEVRAGPLVMTRHLRFEAP